MSLRPYEYLRGSSQTSVSPDDKTWSLSEFLRSSTRGRRIRPVGCHVVLLHEPYETMHGSMYLPEGSMENASVSAKVLDVPFEAGKKGYSLPAASLGKTVDTKAAHDSEARRTFISVELNPGDTVICQRFAGTGIEGYGATFGRLRAVDYGEIYGYAPLDRG